MLSPTQRTMMAALRHDSGPVSLSRLVDELYGYRADGGPEDAARAVRIQMCKLRAKLDQIGIRIETMGRGRASEGYAVSDEHRNAIDALLNARTET